MAEVSIGTAGRDLNMKIAGSDLVGRADQTADRPNQPIGERQPDPNRGEQHGEGKKHENRRETELEAVAMGLKSPEYISDIGRIIRDLRSQRIDASRGV
jgi:hypothetical protein